MFEPYYDERIYETIANKSEKTVVDYVMALDYDGCQRLKGDIVTKSALNPLYENSRDCVLKCKCLIWRANNLRQLNQWGEPAGIMDIVIGWQLGAVLNDAYRRIGQ